MSLYHYVCVCVYVCVIEYICLEVKTSSKIGGRINQEWDELNVGWTHC